MCVIWMQGMTNMLQSVQKEIAIMKKLNHKNCVVMYEVIDCPENVRAPTLTHMTKWCGTHRKIKQKMTPLIRVAA